MKAVHSEDLPAQLREVWRRMAFNALVGNVDDHPLNHGVLHGGASSSLGRRLAPAFDITPAVATLSGSAADGPLLSMATGMDGAARTGVDQLLAAAGHVGLEPDGARVWLQDTATLAARGCVCLTRRARGDVLVDQPVMPSLPGASELVQSAGTGKPGHCTT